MSAVAHGMAALAPATGVSFMPRTFFAPPVSSGCSNTGPASCSNTSVIADTCCFEANGQLLQVQFWDANPPTGPSDAWTIHGLWPDYCGSGYPQNCDPSRAYTNISSILQSLGQQSTLDYMNTFWKNQGAGDETFWAHEWGKHGTCYTTLQPSCLPSDAPEYAEVGAFFDTVVNLYQNLTTYDWLAAAGILPDSTKTWTYTQLTSALKAHYGFTPSFDCESINQVYQVSYYYSLIGSVIDGIYLPKDAPAAGSCPSTGILYLPKNNNATTTSTSVSQTSTTSSQTTSTIPTGTAAPSPLPTGAHFDAVTSAGTFVGGVLSLGTWSTQTLATMHISGTVDGFTITTSKGPCMVSSGTFSCAASVTTPSTFTAIAQPNGALYLAYQGRTAFSSDGTPSGATTFSIYVGTGHAVTFQLSIDMYPVATTTSTSHSSTSSFSTTFSSSTTSTSITPTTTITTTSSTSTSIISTTSISTTSTLSTTASTSATSSTSSAPSLTPSGPTLASGWTAAYACATDTASRVLASPEYYQVTTNSPKYCTTFCGARGFSLAGVEYSNECLCANSYVNSIPPAAAPVADCNMPCSGDANSTCGAGYRMQIYASATAPTDIAALPVGWSLDTPCAVDTVDRVFANTQSSELDNNTPQRCINYCAAQGYTMAGVEYSNECYCGNAYRNGQTPPAAPASQCQFACAGAPGLSCGGSWGIQVYTST